MTKWQKIWMTTITVVAVWSLVRTFYLYKNLNILYYNQQVLIQGLNVLGHKGTLYLPVGPQLPSSSSQSY